MNFRAQHSHKWHNNVVFLSLYLRFLPWHLHTHADFHIVICHCDIRNSQFTLVITLEDYVLVCVYIFIYSLVS